MFSNVVILSSLRVSYETSPFTATRVIEVFYQKRYPRFSKVIDYDARKYQFQTRFPYRDGHWNMLFNDTICPEPTMLEPGAALLSNKLFLYIVNLHKNENSQAKQSMRLVFHA